MPYWPSLVKKFSFHWQQRGMQPLDSTGASWYGTDGLHYPRRGVADTDENGKSFEPCLPKWKLKERTSTGRDQSTWRLFCFTWQPTKGNVSPARMTVQEHDEVGPQFSSSRPLWACLVFIKARALQKIMWSWGMIQRGAEQMRMPVMSPGVHGTGPAFRTKPRGLLGHL